MKFELRHISMILAAMFAMTACVREFTRDDIQSVPDGKGTGEMVFFSSGTTENQVTKATTYYMPNDYRFVCRMYYKAQAGSEAFDVSGNTDQAAWLKVSGNVGNSLYWNKEYNTPTAYDSYGNDDDAVAFYWQNRKEHAFLAWTDMHRAVSMVGGTTSGTLTPKGTVIYEEHTGRQELHYVLSGFKVVGDNYIFKPTFREMLASAINDYANVYNSEAQIEVRNSMPEITDYSTTYLTGWNNIRYYYVSGGVQRHDEVRDAHDHVINYNYGPYVYYVWSESQRVEYTFEQGDVVVHDTGGNYYVWNKNNITVAQRGEVYSAPDGYVKRDEPYDYTDSEGNVWVYHFWAVRYSEFLYDISQPPAYTVALYRFYEEKQAEIINEYEALAFDLTKGTKINMGQQPDILQALTIQAPMGATQESNRVNLYFRHQFSQIQVNLRNSLDNSVEILANDIKKVELLGVTEEGYICTDLSASGTVHPAAYKAIDFSKYSEQQLIDNPYGTSFDMFTMPEAATGYVKSYNAIAFGQLQAIRITWQEQGTSIDHVLTYRIPTAELINLQSSMKYIWNIELRRGTLAVIRADIVDWILPDDELYNGNANGTITN